MTNKDRRARNGPHKPQDQAFVSRRMAAVRSTNNLSEGALRRALHKRGFRYTLYSPKLVGRPDLTFPRYRTVVFVDSDFWHGRVVREQGPNAVAYQVRSANRDSYWLPKLIRNIARDDYVSRTLRKQGWSVIRVWESDVKRDVEAVATAIAARLKKRLGG